MTEKQMRAHLFKIWYRWRKLNDALTDAHNAGLIDYPNDCSDTVFSSHWETRKRIEKYTKDQIAGIVQREIRSQT